MSAAESLNPAAFRVVASDDMLEGFVIADTSFEGDEAAFVGGIREAGFNGPLDDEGLASFLLERPVGAPVRVLRGRKASAGSDTRLEFVLASLAPRAAATEPAAGEREEFAVDHRESRALERCNAGDVLVKKVSGNTAADGVDVYGRVLPAERGKDVKLVAGSNAVLSADGLAITAAIDGVPMREANGRIVVNPAVTVKQVDFKSGNIHFDGAVIVEGDVLQGFSIEATGDVSIKGSVENAQIRAGGSVTVGGGVRRHSVVRAAGDVDVRFVDSESNLEARGTVRVAQNAIQSLLVGDESVVVTGQFVASHARSWNLVEVGVLGCPHGSLTTVVVERPNAALRVHVLREELGLVPANEAAPSRPASHPSGMRPISIDALPSPMFAPPPTGSLPRPTVGMPALPIPNGASKPSVLATARMPTRLPTAGPPPRSILPRPKSLALSTAKVPTDPKGIVRSKVTTSIERHERERLLAHAERELTAPPSAHGRVVAKIAVRPGASVTIAHDTLTLDMDLGPRSFFVGDDGIAEAALGPGAPSSPKSSA